MYGNYRGTSITFDVYDHYGVPAFSKYDTVLLFVSRQPDGSWQHEKYQFFDLYKGTDGEWYGCGDPYRFSHPAKRTVQARPVQFAQPVSYLVGNMADDQVALHYPAPYYAIRDGRAYCLMGAPVPALFQAEKETILTGRGIFK